MLAREDSLDIRQLLQVLVEVQCFGLALNVHHVIDDGAVFVYADEDAFLIVDKHGFEVGEPLLAV